MADNFDEEFETTKKVVRAEKASLAAIEKLLDIIEKRGVIQPEASTGNGHYIYRIPVIAEGSRVKVMASLEVKFLTESEYNMQFSTEDPEEKTS